MAFTERGTRVAVRYRVVEAEELVTSHDNALNVNPDFPAERQPRDRARAASEAQISKIENAINPELLGASPKASDGAPIVAPADNVVESGNARTIALRRAYASGKAEGYRQWLIDNAAGFGLDPAAVGAFKHPVLVRERLTDINRAEFARQANEAAGLFDGEQGKAEPREVAVARETVAQMPDLVVPDENGNPTTAAELMAKADEAMKQANDDAKGFDAAVNCVLRNAS